MSLDEDYVKAQTGKSKQEVIDEIKITIPKLGNSQKICCFQFPPTSP